MAKEADTLNFPIKENLEYKQHMTGSKPDNRLDQPAAPEQIHSCFDQDMISQTSESSWRIYL